VNFKLEFFEFQSLEKKKKTKILLLPAFVVCYPLNNKRGRNKTITKKKILQYTVLVEVILNKIYKIVYLNIQFCNPVIFIMTFKTCSEPLISFFFCPKMIRSVKQVWHGVRWLFFLYMD
jgi:hypothetical protein